MCNLKNKFKQPFELFHTCLQIAYYLVNLVKVKEIPKIFASISPPSVPIVLQNFRANLIT